MAAGSSATRDAACFTAEGYFFWKYTSGPSSHPSSAGWGLKVLGSWLAAELRDTVTLGTEGFLARTVAP